MDVPRAHVTPHPLDLTTLAGALAQPGHGAVALFSGIVRDENAGRRVTHLEYEAYEPLARRTLQRVVDEVSGEWPSVALGIHHRTGRLDVGESSVIIAAASAHRADAFAACRYAIERVKQIVPIWKREFFDGGDVWIEGATADPEDEAARAAARARAVAEVPEPASLDRALG